MRLFDSFFRKRKEKANVREERCRTLIADKDSAIESINCLFTDGRTFIDPEKTRNLKVGSHIIAIPPELKKASLYKELVSKNNMLKDLSENINFNVGIHNDLVTEERITEAIKIFDTVEGRTPDKQQWSCIVREFHNQMVIAGAGTGKTSVVVGKVKYLLQTGRYRPEDILVLSFTRASATEMRERLVKETGKEIRAVTFHKLGKDIISEADGKVPRITDIDLCDFTMEQIQKNRSSDLFTGLIVRYLLFAHGSGEYEEEFKTEKDYLKHLESNPYVTLNNEKVKSFGELDVANYLSINGIKYIYEHPYERDTADKEHGQYRPDFYLPEYGIYIEHFGIDKNGNVPDYFTAAKGKTPSETYQESMKWKRKLHNDNNTLLIECYSYERMEGTLIENLERSLRNAGVMMVPRSSQEVLDSLSGDVRGGLPELIAKVITLIKCNGLTLNNIPTKYSLGWRDRLLLSIVEPIYNAYENALCDRGEIDFNDMINLAAKHIKNGRFVSPYRCVIVDEYQDMSSSRYGLLRSLRENRDFNLFCVGDDWQSIYGFNGSNISLTFDFENHWGPSDICRIERTYRFPKGIAEISGEFVMRNPRQLRKSILSNIDGDDTPVEVITGRSEVNAFYVLRLMLDKLPVRSTVFMIGRYTFDSDRLTSTKFRTFYDAASSMLRVEYFGREDLDIRFLTAHKSKGLQADYVFIINNLSSHMGFPCKIVDADIIESLTNSDDRFPHAEERRLFYVAMTRAKRKTILVTVNGNKSEFVKELEKRYGKRLLDGENACPSCGGRLVQRNGPYSSFLGCSGYPECKYKRKITNRMD